MSRMLYEHQTNATIIRAIGSNPIRTLCTFKAKNINGRVTVKERNTITRVWGLE